MPAPCGNIQSGRSGYAARLLDNEAGIVMDRFSAYRGACSPSGLLQW